MSASDWPIDIDPVFGCWRWTGKLDSAGYPIVWRGRTPVKAYLVVYAAELGHPVPAGMVLDHACRVRSCVRIEAAGWSHLEAVTQSENLKRRSWRYRVRRTTCSKGHPLWDAMMTGGGGRLCRTCARDAGVGGRR